MHLICKDLRRKNPSKRGKAIALYPFELVRDLDKAENTELWLCQPSRRPCIKPFHAGTEGLSRIAK